MKKKTKYYISILFSAIIIVVGFIYLAQSYNVWAYLNPGADPLTYWKFDEGILNTCIDNHDLCEEMGWNADYIGSTIWEDEDQCISGLCLYLDGTGDYGELSGDLGDPSAMTIDFWFRKADINAGSQYIADARNAADTDNWYILQDYPVTYCPSTNGNVCFSGLVEIPDSMLSNNTWFHVAITADVSSTAIYLDGELVDTGAAHNPDFGPTFTIGARYTHGNNFLGNIDEFKIFDYVRTPAQIKASYNSGKVSAGAYTGSGAALGSGGDLSGNSPILRMSLNEDENSSTTAYDSSTNKFLGTVSGSGGWTVGKYGGAKYFAGSADYISVPYDSIIQPTNITVSAWVLIDDDIERYIISKAAGPGGYALRFSTAGNLEFLVYVNGSYRIPVDSTTNFWTGWHYVTGTYDGRYARLYADGKLMDTVDVGASYDISYTGTAPLCIGIGSSTGGCTATYPFYGAIDELVIYDYAKSTKQIMEDMYANVGLHPMIDYNFDTGYGNSAYDSGISNIDHLITGDKIFSPNGKFGSSLYFNGSTDYISAIWLTHNMSWSDSFSVSTWINIPSAATWDTTYKSTIIGRGSYLGSHGLISNTTNNEVSMYIRSDTTESFASSSITRDAWYHLVGTWDGSYSKLYVNGELKDTTAISPTGSPDVTSWSIGGPIAYGGGTGSYFNGYLDNVKIYNYALDATEVIQDFNQGSLVVLGTESSSGSTWADGGFGGNSPVFWFSLDEGTGIALYSSGSSEITGTTWDGTPDWVPGKYGWALSFDGSTEGIYIDDINTYPHETMTAWVYIDPTETNGDIVGNAHTNSNNYGFTFYIDNNTLRAKAEQGNDTYFYSNVTADITSLKGGWIHLAMTWDSLGTGSNGCDDLLKLYVNGLMVDSDTHNFPYNVSQNYNCTFPYPYPFSIGATTETSLTRQTKVKVDDIRVYDYVRSNAQIAFDYNGGKPMHHWTFNEGTGTTAYSKVSTNDGTTNNGTLNNMEAGDWVTTGQRGYGLSFGGTDERVSHTAVTFTSSQPWSATHWIYWPTSTNTYDFYIGQYSAAGNGLMLRKVSANTFSFRNTAQTYYDFTAGSSAQINDRWAHLAWVYDGAGNLSLYIDGELYQTLTSVVGSMVFDSIGAGYPSASYFLIGILDEVKIYAYNLSADQVKLDMNEGVAYFE